MKKLFYTERYKYLAEKLAKDIPLGEFERKTFSDGETYFRFKESLKGKDVIILGGTVSDEETLDIFDMACAASMYGAKSINLVIPYFGYSTMERAVNSGEVVKAKTRARILSGIPRAIEINTVYLFDLHVSGIVHYFENELHAVHMYGKKLIPEVIKKIGKKNLVLASPDEGRVKWVSSLAKENNLPLAVALKQRDGEDTENIAVDKNVKGKNVLIYDDMIRSGGTLSQAAKAYKDAGAKKIYVVASHGVFTSEKLINSELFEKIYVSNSHPNALNKKNVEILDISNIILESLDENL